MGRTQDGRAKQENGSDSAGRSSQLSIVEYLSAHRVLGGVPRSAWDVFAPQIIERRYKKGHYFFRTDDAASHVFAIVSGLASLAEEDSSGREHELYNLSPGDVFGLAATILGIPRTRSAKALVDSDALLIRRETFEDLQQRFPDFARKVTLELCRLLCLSEKNAVQFALRSVTARLAKLLLEIEAIGSPVLFLSHRELAFRIGCSRETVTRALGRFERDGIVSARRGQMQILNRRKLIALANEGDR